MGAGCGGILETSGEIHETRVVEAGVRTATPLCLMNFVINVDKRAKNHNLSKILTMLRHTCGHLRRGLLVVVWW